MVEPNPEVMPPHQAILRASVHFHDTLGSYEGYLQYAGCVSPISHVRLDDKETARQFLAAMDSHIVPMRGMTWAYGKNASECLQGYREQFLANHRDILPDAKPLEQ